MSGHLPTDQLVNLSHITRKFQELALINDWQAYHTPKNLAVAAAVEAGELLAEFQWLTAEQSNHLSPPQKQRVANEVADVMMYLTELCHRLDINMAEAIDAKIQLNQTRFSVDAS